MNYFCTDCKRSCMGEESTDELLPPAIICEYCGSEVSASFDSSPEKDAGLVMNNIINLTPPGSLASGYKLTLETLDRLMLLLNALQIKGQLPTIGILSQKIDAEIQSALITIRLGQLHFPDMKFGEKK